MEKKIYDNSNIAESYAGVTTPLTFSFARYVYQEVYQHFSKMMGTSDKLIQENKFTFEHMIEFIGHRIYYNLNSWYTMLSFFPAYKFSSEFMEKMMGVEKRNTFAVEKSYNFFSKYLFYFPKTILQCIRIIFVFSLLGRQMKKFSQYFENVFSELNTIDLEKLNLDELKQLYNEAENRLLSQWKIPIANDFAVMVSTGLADKLFRKWLASDKAYSYMTSGVNKPLTSLDPGNKIIHIAHLIRQNENVKNIFLNGYSEEEILALLRGKLKTHGVANAIENYLEDFGTRMPNELKLESETLTENPKSLISILKKLIKADNSLRKSKEADLRDTLFDKLRLPKRIFLQWLLQWSGNSIHRREEARFYRTLIFGYVRRIFLAIGQKLTREKIIKNERDIFYLTKEEIFNIIDGKQLSPNPDLIAEQRKREFEKWQNLSFPRRIESAKDIPAIEEEILHKQFATQNVPLDNLIGRVASCPDKLATFSGIALTLKSFDPSADFEGKILVTSQTDPGWTIVFPFLKGVVVERGGMLSHAAIVARELNIPCIVGVERATDVIASGMNIKLNLQSGLIQKL